MGAGRMLLFLGLSLLGVTLGTAPPPPPPHSGLLWSGSRPPTLAAETPPQDTLAVPAMSPLGARTAPGIATEQGAAAPHDDRRGSCNDWSTYSTNIAQHGTTGKAMAGTRTYSYPEAGSSVGDQFKEANPNVPTWSTKPLIATNDNAESVSQQSGCTGTACSPSSVTWGGSSLPISARGACGTASPVYSHLS